MKTDNGYVPQPIGEEFQLGDYGYFEGSTWNRMGNIRGLSICDLQKENRPSNTIIELQQSIEIKAEAEAITRSGDFQAGCLITFEKEDGFYQKANVDYYEMFSSIDEVSRLLKDLYSKGLWKSKYSLIVNVVHSSSFITLFSKSKGAKVKLKIDLDGADIGGMVEAHGTLGIEANENEVIKIVCPKLDNRQHASGARFVQLKRVFPYITNRREGNYMGIDEALQVDNHTQEEMTLILADDI